MFKWFYKYLQRREEREQLNKDLIKLLHEDKSLTKEQYEKLVEIIIYAGQYWLHNVPQYKCYNNKVNDYRKIENLELDAQKSYKILKFIHLSDN